MKGLTLFSLSVAFVFVSGIVKADTFTTRYGQAQCSETIENDDGRSFEFYGEVDTDTDEATIGFRYEIEFQKPNMRSNRCDGMNSLALRRMILDLERQELELQILRNRVEAVDTTGSRNNDDW
mgnify:CR=1 FL=1